jgi:small subunit ribosomal protein S16
MVRIRLRRMGLKKQPSYRIVIADQRSSRDGGFIESIGHHNPRTIPSTDIVDEARALYWLSVGAQPSEAIVSVFKRTGTMERFARLKKGETIETLVAEAEAAKAAAEPISPKTSHPAPAAGQSAKKAKEAAAVAADAATEDAAS